MDEWQKHTYDKLGAFVNEEFLYDENEVCITLNKREAYVVMKAMEDQHRFQSPMITIPEESIGDK